MGQQKASWLDELEDKVREAGQRIQSLREESSSLRQRVQELEARLEDMAGDEKESAWEAERQEVRDRVEGLVQLLEGLLED